MHEFEIDEIKETLLTHGYEYVKVLGNGPFSTVVLCNCKDTHQQVAVKREFKREISAYESDALNSLNHAHIITLYNSFTDDNYQYLVMEYCPNGTMHDKTNLSYNSFVYYAKQILEAISYCHSNKIAHRDIKPDNIFIDEYNHIKLADFGFAKQFDDDMKSTEKCGSLNFLSPEILQSQEVCPFKADVWALGVTFFYMISGTNPFKGKTRKDLKQSIIYSEIDFSQYNFDTKIKFLLSKMLAKKPKNRPTIENLLSFNIFSSNLQKKTTMPTGFGRRNSYTTGFVTLTFDSNDFSFNSDNKNLQKDPLSYKNINFYPNIQRVYGRSLAKPEKE